MIRRLLMTACMMGGLCAGAVAQVAFPAPLPNQSAQQPQFPPVNQSSAPAQGPAAFPPVSGSGAPASPAASSPFPSPTGAAPPPGVFQQGTGVPPVAAAGFGSTGQEVCMGKFAPLRADAEKRAKAIQNASARKATARQACGLIKDYVASEKKVVDYVTANQVACGMPAEIPSQLKANQARSQEMMRMVCRASNDPPTERPIILDPPNLEPRRILDPPDQRPFRVLRINAPIGPAS